MGGGGGLRKCDDNLERKLILMGPHHHPRVSEWWSFCLFFTFQNALSLSCDHGLDRLWC